MSEIGNAAGIPQSSTQGETTSGEISYVNADRNESPSGSRYQEQNYNVSRNTISEDTETSVDPGKEVKETVDNKEEARTESDKEEKTQKEDQPERWQAQFEKLSRRDAEIRMREQAIKDKEIQVAELQELRKIASEKGELEAIKALGWSPDRILKQMANGGRPDPLDEIASLRDEVKNLREESTRGLTQVEEKRMTERWQQEYDSLIQKDDYKILREWEGAEDQIYKNVSQHYRNTGELLHPKQELDKLTEGLKARLKKLGYPVDAAIAEQSKSAKDIKPKDTPKVTQGLKTMNPKLGAAASNTRKFFDDEDAEMARISAKYS